MSDFDHLTYRRCTDCWHFVDENTSFGELPGIAEYLHMDDGEKEHDHDAAPGEGMTFAEWKRTHPELFVTYTDGKIGPNSEHFGRTGLIMDADYHDPLHGDDKGPCSDFAPDTLGEDPGVCTTCFYQGSDHPEQQGRILDAVKADGNLDYHSGEAYE